MARTVCPISTDTLLLYIPRSPPGSNRVKKSFPWYFEDMLNSDDEFALMAEMGFNVVRLGFMWSGYHIAEGVFNQSYIDVIKTIVDKMWARGIYTLLDMHEGT